MNTLLAAPGTPLRTNGKPDKVTQVKVKPHGTAFDPKKCELLRQCAWQLGESRATDAYSPWENHVGLAQVSPCQGFTHWRIRQEWIDDIARQRGATWQNCRLIVRIYDVSYITFTGLNANHIQDHTLPAICGDLFFKLPRPGSWQIAEVGFLLRCGEFIPAARSATVCVRSRSSLVAREPGRLAGNALRPDRGSRQRLGSGADPSRTSPAALTPGAAHRGVCLRRPETRRPAGRRAVRIGIGGGPGGSGA